MNSHSGPRHFHFVSTLPCRRKSSENFVFEGILQIVSHTFLGRANERLSAPSSFIYIHFARQRTKERSYIFLAIGIYGYKVAFTYFP